MKNFWNLTLEFKAFIISLTATLIGFLGTTCLFWFNHYEIPLAVLLGGSIVYSTWLILYFNKKKGEGRIRFDIFAIYLRLALVAILTITFAAIQIGLKVVIISPIFLVVSYLVISLLTLLAFIRKDKNV